MRDMWFASVPKRKRKSWQRYIFHINESPHHTPAVKSFPSNFFNWTATYRRDGDIFVGYGQIKMLPDEIQRSTSDYELLRKVFRRHKLVAWFAGNCKTPSEREIYIKEMEKHIQIDTYGECGTLNCSKSSHKECVKMLSSTYK